MVNKVLQRAINDEKQRIIDIAKQEQKQAELDALKVQNAEEYKGKEFVCPVCNKGFDKLNALNCHQIAAHTRKTNGSPVKRKYKKRAK